jgi:rsbT co-antagonist protein RsbR
MGTRARFEALLDRLEREHDGDAGRLSCSADEICQAGRALIDDVDALEAIVAAREEQVALQGEMLRSIGLPILQVRADVLCAALVGSLDPDRAVRITDTLLRSAVERRVRLAVVDVTAATVGDASTAKHLVDLVRALRLVGVHAVISGMLPETARAMAELPEGLGSVRCYATLASALASHDDGGGRTGR